jgi:hypothetical protein
MSFCIFYKNFELFLRDEKTFIKNFKNSYNFRFVGFYENIFFLCFFCSSKSILYFLCTVSGCDGGNRTRNIAVYTWRFHINLFTGIMAKQTDGITCQNTAAHSKTKRTRHKQYSQGQGGRGGKVPQGEKREQGKQD